MNMRVQWPKAGEWRRVYKKPIMMWSGGLGMTTALLLMLSGDGYADAMRSPMLGAIVSCSHRCEECGENKHKIISSGTKNASSAHEESCNPGSCASHSCDVIEAGLGDLLTTVYRADGRNLKELLDGYPNTLSWNEARQSVQVTCSEGFTIANVPLSSEQARLLAE